MTCRRRRQFVSTVAAVAAVAGSSAIGWPAFGRGPARRIVSVGPDMTELVYALGAGDRVVATDTSSVWPEAARATPKVGYLRNLSAEGLLAVEPDLLLLSGAAGPDSTLAQLRAIGVPIVQAPDEYTLTAARAKIALIGDAIGEPERAARLAAGFDRDVRELESMRERSTTVLRGAFLLGLGRGSPQAAGGGTAAQAILELVGVDNVFGHDGYKAVSAEAMVAARPDVVLVMGSATSVDEAAAAAPGLDLTPAGRNGRIVAVDGAALLSFGPRVASAAADLFGALRTSAVSMR